MYYFFIANNPDNELILNELQLSDEYTVVVFNDNMYSNSSVVKQATYKYHIFREHALKDNTLFWGEELLSKESGYNNILISPYSNCMNEQKNNIIEFLKKKYNSIYANNFSEMLHTYNYNKQKKSPQTGSLTFEYFKNNIDILHPDNEVYLVGFTSVYKKNLWVGHSKELEDAYFKTQMDTAKNIKRI